ncbi:PREDICTED: alpha-glucan water dikinase 2 isoform X1 [Prunus mume]|uniref:Alpha-glucan water dikinase 2 isoform X1 n=1 Tax=Prunus mume TaxID=102107 RepID=A0ABM0N410_PRUMU|nr:PREDICTED: alpha-glucan water dikinase 2 isoform X1 [Prunus mume]
MAASSASQSPVPRLHHFELVERMKLQINVSGSSKGRNVRLEFQLSNCANSWILHWGCLFRGNMNWFIPNDRSSGSQAYKQGSLQTPFTKKGELYLLTIELRDPNLHAIEFVLKDGSRERWLKLNHGNFRIEIPETDPTTLMPPIPKELIERNACLAWESKGRPVSSPQQEKQDYEDALRDLQSQMSKGISLNELQCSFSSPSSKRMVDNREQLRSGMSYSYKRKHNVEQWLQKHSTGSAKNASMPNSALMDLVDKSMGGDDVVSRISYHVGNYEIVVLSKMVRGDYHIFVAMNMRGAIVLHWGVSKLSPGEWLAPPPEILPKKSNLVPGACQTYFTDISTGKGSFQVVDINLQQSNLLGIQFVIWSGESSWIKNNGTNFFVGVTPVISSGKASGDGDGIFKWLLDEISRREKEAERSLMHRFNIATELTERCKNEGEFGLVGILVWLRFMSCRHLTWNKNYNVKPREISEAQDRFTNLLQRIYLNQPNDREIVRLLMTHVGRGGQGDVGQRIRDEILVIQRNNDCKGGMMEEWHQKLHNNSSPDDVIICEALLNYIKSGFRVDVYWKALNTNGLTKEKLASYDRPIVSEPHFRVDTKEGLIHDLTAYLKTLKAVHSGADLESAIEVLVPSNKAHDFTSTGFNYVCDLSPKLQECLKFVKVHLGDEDIVRLMEKLLESRIELRPVLIANHRRLKDILFLDLALDSSVRTTMERGLKNLNFAHLPEIMFFISLVLENVCLSTVNNEDLIYCTKDWYYICELYKPNDGQWALQTKAILDRLQLVLADRSQCYQNKIQPSAQYLGNLLGVQKSAIDTFSEELIRAGSAAILSALINRFYPILRKVANLGCWQVISPVDVCGVVLCVNELRSIQNKVYRKPTILIATRVTGEEEIPDGVVAVLTPDIPDVLSHVSIRARNEKVCFATCFDPNILRDLKTKEGKSISILVKSANIIIRDISSSNFAFKSFGTQSKHQGLTLRKKAFCSKYAISVEEFTSEVVGAKSCNLKFLRGKVPTWIKIPMSVAIPFGAFEKVLSEDFNKDIAYKISSFYKCVKGGDLSKLQSIQETILRMNAPISLTHELKSKMRSSGIPWPGDEGDERWNHAWQAIKKVWASKWNERAFISCRKANLDHENICMAVLVQEIICADYAFVIHTKNPLSGDTSEIYTEIVKGLGETLVGAYPGRAMSFITKKSNLSSPIVIGYPSKPIGLYSKKSIIFRSDSNAEDLEGYAGAGLYDSVIMDKEEKIVLDYSRDRMIIDRAFQISLFSRIAEVGKIVGGLYGRPQDIEGVVKDGVIYVVQSRPQI